MERRPFCPHCGSEYMFCDSSEYQDGDMIWEARTETWHCGDCGEDFVVHTEWKMSCFGFADDSTPTGLMNDTTYEVSS